MVKETRTSTDRGRTNSAEAKAFSRLTRTISDKGRTSPDKAIRLIWITRTTSDRTNITLAGLNWATRTNPNGSR
jgi:hypothetical protein